MTRSSIAYRGYVIRTTPFASDCWIEKDGFYIASAPSLGDAKSIIDSLVYNW